LDHRRVEQGRRPQISDGKKISAGSGTPEAFARGQALSKFARNEKIDFGRIAATRLSQLPESLCKAAIERPPSIVNAAVDDLDRLDILSFERIIIPFSKKTDHPKWHVEDADEEPVQTPWVNRRVDIESPQSGAAAARR
jgi:hypothetical protein